MKWHASPDLKRLQDTNSSLTTLTTLNYHRIKYQLIRKLSLTPVSFISLSSRRCHGDDVRDDGNEVSPNLLGLSAFTLFLMMLSHTGGKLCLSQSLLRLGFKGCYIDGFLYPSFKPSGFSCQDFSVLQFHAMLRLFKVNVF